MLIQLGVTNVNARTVSREKIVVSILTIVKNLHVKMGNVLMASQATTAAVILGSQEKSESS